MGIITETKNEPMPQEIVEKFRELIGFPRSFRLATELFDLGVKAIKESNLYIPFFRYNVLLEYLGDFGVGLIGYSRLKNSKTYDFMRFATASCGEEGFSVDIYRAKDSEISLEGRFAFVTNPRPRMVRLQRIDDDFNQTGEIMEYPLEYRSHLTKIL